MPAKAFNLTVVTPERPTFDGRAVYLNLPAWEGSMGILAGHAPALVVMKEGLIHGRLETGEEEILAVSGGFAEITPQKVTLFAETAELAQEIDEDRARLSAARAREEIRRLRSREKGHEDIDIEKAQAALRRALARIRAAEALRQEMRRR